VNRGTSAAATVVFDAVTNAPWAGTVTTGAKAYDTATVTPSAGFTATGTVTYTIFPNGACTGTGAPAGRVTLATTGSVPVSPAQGPLAAGDHSFHAVYSGDGNYAGTTSACEPFRVGKGTSSTATKVFDDATQAGWTTTEVAGAKAFDTATVTPSAGIAATGTVSYTFFPNDACTAGTGSPAGGGALVNGLAPNSSTVGPLSAGTYSFQAVYSGDANYGPSSSNCEPFVVDPAVPPAKQAPITPVIVPVTG
jgi:hypothetical protein